MIDWGEILNPEKNLNEKVQETINTLNKIIDKHAPIKLASQNKQRQLNKPWLTKGILKSVKRKQKMYHSHFLSKDFQKVKKYKHYAAVLSHFKNKSKTEYYSMQFSKHKDNLKQTWKLIGTLMLKGKPKVKPSPRELLKIIELLHKKRILLNNLITFL